MRFFFSDVLNIVRKDLLIEKRTKELFFIMLIFALSILFIINFSLNISIKSNSENSAGIIWLILILSGQLCLNNIMSIEKQDNVMDAILSAPCKTSAIYLSKTFSVFLFMFLMSIIIIPMYCIFFNLPFSSLKVLPTAALGSFGYAALGVLLSSMTVQTRRKDILLPVLFFPLIIPLIVAAVNATQLIFAENSFTSGNYWIGQMAAYSLIYFTIGILFFDFIIKN